MASGSCQPVSSPSTARTPRSGVTTRLGPAGGGLHGAVRVRRGLERAHHGRADGDDAAAARPGAVDAVRRRPDTRKRSGYGGSPRSGEQTPVCRTIRATPTPRSRSTASARGVNGRPALGISALPGSAANIVWWSASGRATVSCA